MLRVYAVMTIFIGIFSLMWPFYPNQARADTLKISTGEWPPYVSEKMDKNGIIAEIISEVFKEMNMDVVYVFYPWKRAYAMVKTGKIWASFPYAANRNRLDEVLFSDLITYSTSKLFYYKKHTSPQGIIFEKLSDLKAYRIGGVSGYYYEDIFKTADIEVDYVKREISALEKLRLGRTDLVPMNELVGWHMINAYFKEDAENFAVLPKIFDRHELHLIASKNYPDSKLLLMKFNKALESVKTKFLYKAILEKYGLR